MTKRDYRERINSLQATIRRREDILHSIATSVGVTYFHNLTDAVHNMRKTIVLYTKDIEGYKHEIETLQNNLNLTRSIFEKTSKELIELRSHNNKVMDENYHLKAFITLKGAQESETTSTIFEIFNILYKKKAKKLISGFEALEYIKKKLLKKKK